LGGAVISASDSSATPSTDTTPPGTSSMQLTKAQQKALRPKAVEASTSLAVQADLIMGDGSNPPSYEPSEIDREEVEERILAGGGTLYPRPELESDFVTVQADLMLVDPFESPAPSYAPSMADDVDYDDERGPGQVSFSFDDGVERGDFKKTTAANGNGTMKLFTGSINDPAKTSVSNVSFAPARPNLGVPPPTISSSLARPTLSPQAPVPSRPNINTSVQEQEDLMGQDLAHRPRLESAGAQDDII